MTHKSYKEESRRDWGTDSKLNLNLNQINTGALLRIADALETISSRYQTLIDENQFLKKRLRDSQGTAGRLQRSNAALKGVITKLRNNTALKDSITKLKENPRKDFLLRESKEIPEDADK